MVERCVSCHHAAQQQEGEGWRTERESEAEDTALSISCRGSNGSDTRLIWLGVDSENKKVVEADFNQEGMFNRRSEFYSSRS
jgi:hypothetical protein